MSEYTRSLNYRMTERFTFQRYEKFSEDILPKEAVLRYEKASNRRYRINRDNTAFEELSKETFRFVRFEIDNPYHIHTMIPSARGYNSNCIFLYETDTNKVSIYVYSLQEDCFYLVYQKPNISLSEKNAELWIVYDRGKVGQKYGDFGFILSLLDCGHLLHQGKVLSSSLNKPMKVHYGGKFKEQVPWEVKNGCVLARINLNEYRNEGELILPIEAEPDESEIIDQVSFLPQDGLAKDPVLNDFLDKFVECQGWTEELLFEDDINCNQLIFNSRYRSSSQAVQGYSFLKYLMEKEEVEKVISYVQKLINYSAYGDFISANLLFPTEDGIEVVMIFKDKIESHRVQEFNFNEVLYDSKEFFELSRSSMVAYTKINYDVLEENESIYAYCMMQSAEIIHGLSLYLTGIGLSTRPMKNINEKYLERYFNEEDFFTSYLLVAGKSHNYSLFSTF